MKRKSKKNKKFKLWEIIFNSISALMVLVCIIVYGYRLIHYYIEEHPEEEDNHIAEYIIRNSTNEELYSISSNYYYFKGIEVNNYIYYNGILYRIIDINNDNIKLISDSSLTNIVWGYNTEYKESYIHNWLDKYSNNYNKDDINKYSICIDNMELSNVTCNSTIEEYVGLLSISDYIRAGGVESYLNNSEYYWTSNSLDNSAYFVNSSGGLSNTVSKDDIYYSYGIRPVIILKNNYIYYGGDGSKESPYMINEDNNIVVGKYIKYSDYIWRIQEVNDNYIKIIMDGYIENKYNYSKGIKYLNNEFYKKLDKSSIKKCVFNTGSYGKNSKYDYNNVFSKNIESYVGISSVSDIFNNKYTDSWLYTSYEGNSLQYKVNSQNRLIGDSSTNSNYLVPVICLSKDINIKEGNGYIDSPYIIGE